MVEGPAEPSLIRLAVPMIFGLISILLIPLVYLGSQFWIKTGLFVGIALANLATGAITWLWFRSSIVPGALR